MVQTDEQRHGAGIARRPVVRAIAVERTASPVRSWISVPGPNVADIASERPIEAPAAHSVSAVETALLRWVAPRRLAAVQGVLALLLVLIELAAPTPRSGFKSLTLSNAVGSDAAARARVLFHESYAAIPLLGANLTVSPAVYVWGLRLAIVGFVLVQGLALLACLRGPTRSLRAWAMGPVLTTFVLVFYPPINTDVYFYASVGDVANRGWNPYLTTPESLRGDPFLRFHDWGEITTPYGPLWTAISQGLVGITRADPFWTPIGFKFVTGLAALALGGVAYLLAKRLTTDPRRRLAVFVLVAWQPALLAESAATAHHDAILTLLAMTGLLVLTLPHRGATRGGLLLIAASALIKPVTLPLLGLAGLWRLRQRADGARALARRWALDALAIGLLIAAAMTPYWAGTRLLSGFWSQSERLYVDKPLWANPLWFWLPQLLGFDNGGGKPNRFIRDHAPAFSQRLAGLIVAGAVLWLGWRAWQVWRGQHAADQGSPFSPTRIRPLLIAWAVASTAVALIPVNAHAWYAIWPVVPVALVWATNPGGPGATMPRTVSTPVRRTQEFVAPVQGALPWWLVLYLAWSAISFLIYHTLVTT